MVNELWFRTLRRPTWFRLVQPAASPAVTWVHPWHPWPGCQRCPLISAPPCGESRAIGWESIGTTCGKNSHVSPQSLGDIHPKSDFWALAFLCFHHHHHQLSEWSSKPSKVSSGVAPDALPSGRALPLVAHRGVYCPLGLQWSMISTHGNNEMIWNAGSCSKMVGMQGSNAGKHLDLLSAL